MVAFLLFPLIMATIPFVKTQGNLRYLFFLAPFLCLLLARLVGSRRVAAAVLAAAVVVTGVGLARVQVVSEAAGGAAPRGRGRFARRGRAGARP